MEKYEELLVAIRRVIRAIDLRSKKLSKDVGITGPQLLVLQELGADPGITAKQVSDIVNLSQATVTSILDRLETKSMVERVRSESDRRRIALYLTEQGKETLKNAPRSMEDSFIEKFNTNAGEDSELDFIEIFLKSLDLKDEAPVPSKMPQTYSTVNIE